MDLVTLDETDLAHLRRCVELAREALEDGDEPFGSLLVSASGDVLLEDRNRVKGGDHTRHPELAIAQWSAQHQAPQDRATSTVYTSGEHCPMCAAAHGWVGLGRIVAAVRSRQLAQWLEEWNEPTPVVATLPVEQVVPGALLDGPAPELEAEMRALHRARVERDRAGR
jgi:tRNA(Arg) A34 adenosine deaminase TadA